VITNCSLHRSVTGLVKGSFGELSPPAGRLVAVPALQERRSTFMGISIWIRRGNTAALPYRSRDSASNFFIHRSVTGFADGRRGATVPTFPAQFVIIGVIRVEISLCSSRLCVRHLIPPPPAGTSVFGSDHDKPRASARCACERSSTPARFPFATNHRKRRAAQ